MNEAGHLWVAFVLRMMPVLQTAKNHWWTLTLPQDQDPVLEIQVLTRKTVKIWCKIKYDTFSASNIHPMFIGNNKSVTFDQSPMLENDIPTKSAASTDEFLRCELFFIFLKHLKLANVIAVISTRSR